MLHIAGIKNKASDALSCHPCDDPSNDEPDQADIVASVAVSTHTSNHHFLAGICSIEAVDALSSYKAVTWDMVRDATCNDQNMRNLVALWSTFRTDSLTPPKTFPQQSAHFISTVMNCLLLMASLSMVIESSSHPPSRGRYWTPFTQHTKESPQCSPVQSPQSSGQESPQQLSNAGNVAATATEWHPPILVPLQRHPHSQPTHSRLCAVTTSNTAGNITLLLSTVTPTGPLWSDLRKVQLDSWMSSNVHS